MEQKTLKSRELFGERPVWGAIFALAMPSCVTILVMFVYNMADLFFIGMSGDNAQVAAVSVVSPVFSLLTALSTMLGIGGCSVIARTSGEGRAGDARAYASLCFYAGIAFGLFCTAALLAGTDGVLRMFGANEEILPFARSYMRILSGGAVFMLLPHVLSAIIRADGGIREGLVGNMAGTLLNLVLDPVFILTLHMGVAGAALATVLGNVVSTLLYMRYLWRNADRLGVNLRLALAKLPMLLHILAVGLPNGVSSLLAGLASTFSNRLLVAYGTDAVAAMGAAGKATMIISMIHMGICMGVQPMMAYNYGAGNEKRLKEILKKLGLLTVLVGCAAMLGCFFGRRAFIGMFLKNGEAAAMGEALVPLLVAASPVLGLYYMGTNFLQASGSALAATLVSLLRQGLILIPALFALERVMGFTGIGAAHMTADLASVAVALAVLLRQYRGFLRERAGLAESEKKREEGDCDGKKGSPADYAGKCV